MDNNTNHQLKRNLSSRHIQLISISGAIGTGLFMGSGKTISAAGPSIIFVYMLIGFMLFFVMRAMGELLLSNLQYHSFSDFAGDLLGPWASYFIGWTYWFCWIVTGIADAIAISGYINYWFPNLALWIPMFICVLILITLNLLTVKMFGESEFWFSMIKIIAIIALIIVGTFMVIIGYKSNINGEIHTASIANLWQYGGFFPKGIHGFFLGFQIAIFAFVGIELVGTTAAETKNPENNLPKAINAIPIRVIIFYMLSLIAIMSVIPWKYAMPGVSPFVELFDLAGIGMAASIINFVVLTSAASSANSGVYSTSRMAYGLSQKGQAPLMMSKLSRNSVPINALFFTGICLMGGVLVLYLIPNLGEAFDAVTTVSAILFMFVWTIILVSYLAYRKKFPEKHSQSKFKMPGDKVFCYVVIIFFIFILYTLTLENHTFDALLITPIWFVILFITYFMYYRKHQYKILKK